ncbi:hypothetical protein JCM5353_002354 [Sporobolomyces roseus]
MSLPEYSPETNNILALLNDDTASQLPSSPTSSSSPSSSTPATNPQQSHDNVSTRPMNFSSAFSGNQRPKRTAAIAASQNLALQAQTARQHYNNDNNGYEDFSLPNNSSREGGGPGPNSIAAAVARNGIQGDFNVDDDPYRLPEPPGANDEMYAALLRSGASNLDELVQRTGEGEGGKRGKRKKREQEQEEGKGEGEPVKRGRGRPRKDGKPPGTPKSPPPPPKKRGRPSKKDLNSKTAQPRQTTKGKRKFVEDGDELALPTPPDQFQSLLGGGGESYFPDLGAAIPQLSPSSNNEDSDSESSSSDTSGSQSGESERGEEREKKKRSRRRNKKGEPPLIPRIFRQARLSRGEDEPLLDLEVHEKEEKEVEKEELTEEQKNEIRRAMNPVFATKLLEALEEHSEYYDRAYRALHEELLATQIEESLLQHVKEVVLVSEIKDMVYEKQGVPPDHQRLIYQGKQMEDQRTASDYDLKDGSVIIMVLKLKGCACGCGMYPPWADEDVTVKSEDGVAIKGQA